MQFINEHKNFIFTILGGAAVFFICMYFIDGIFAQVNNYKKEIQQQETLTENRLEKLKAPGNKQGLRYQRSLAPVLEKNLLSSIKEETLFEPSPSFQWKKDDDNPSFNFSTKKSKINQDLTLLADRMGFDFPNLGFSKSNVTREEISEYLMRLELVEKILRHAILSGLKKVTTINGEVKSTEHPLPGTSVALDRLPIELVVVGENKAILNFLAGFSRQKMAVEEKDLPHLELTKLVLTPSTSSKYLTAHIQLTALRLKSLKKKVPGKSGGGTKSKNPWRKKNLIRKWR